MWCCGEEGGIKRGQTQQGWSTWQPMRAADAASSRDQPGELGTALPPPALPRRATHTHRMHSVSTPQSGEGSAGSAAAPRPRRCATATPGLRRSQSRCRPAGGWRRVWSGVSHRIGGDAAQDMAGAATRMRPRTPTHEEAERGAGGPLEEHPAGQAKHRGGASRDHDALEGEPSLAQRDGGDSGGQHGVGSAASARQAAASDRPAASGACTGMPVHAPLTQPPVSDLLLPIMLNRFWAPAGPEPSLAAASSAEAERGRRKEDGTAVDAWCAGCGLRAPAACAAEPCRVNASLHASRDGMVGKGSGCDPCQQPVG